ncbi:MAG: hypothetical protein ABIP03_07320 [Aquihabitans sp.]
MSEQSGASAVVLEWRRDTLAEYLDVDAGVPVAPAEALSILNGEAHAIALTSVELRIADLVAVLDDVDLARVAAAAIDDLYRAGCTLPMWSPNVAAYIRATWAVMMGALNKRGLHLQFVIDHGYPERIGRPLELYPDLFTAAGLVYVCPHHFANQLPDAVDADVSIEGLDPFILKGRRLAFEEAQVAVGAGRHLVYLEIASEPGALDDVLGLASRPGTIALFRDTPPSPDSKPHLSATPRSPN